MEYEFEVIHREGRLNCCADTLSRIHIKENEEQTSTKTKTVCLVKTRAKSKKEIQDMKKHEDIKSSEETEPNNHSKSNRLNSFNIIEKRGFIHENKDFDHITFFFDKVNCKLRRLLQHKIKKTIELKDIVYGELVVYEDNKSIILIPQLLNDENSRSNAEKSIKTFLTFIAQKLYEKVAIDIDIRDSLSYFEFKKLLRKWFTSTPIEVTIYLNTVIQVFDPQQMNNILLEFHCTTHGSHAGWNRMYENIRKYFNWTNMISDIKSFVKNCELCQKIKTTTHTKQPIIISNTPMASFANLVRLFTNTN